MRIQQQEFGGNKYLRGSMKVQSYRCDYCSKLKGESNRWWLGQPDGERFTLALWDVTAGDENGLEHICSESCATKALSKWMTQSARQITRPIGKRK
jgi:hypothetical protein